ncbi:MAG: hypothetical protein A4E38_00042 [Methanoregulaceae archaeon PtaB.Bin108]|nr:MAG: hypothetical protein A4E38_00042 [Methanoregulaceae archaeon PtaB.Bin108]OPY40359.1 MAG: hypothetical protein A4E42_02180 [Methanoregulaceae archaeon PtaU1.Bin222]
MEKKTPGKEIKKSAKTSKLKNKATVTPSIPPARPAQVSVVKEKPASAAAAKKPVKSTAQPSQKPGTKTSTVKPAAKAAKTAKK